ncbi:hypothetical protein H6F89_33915 [Cyanobacteria bacterium FACHB-63]|nr:hypothetical protein [Cyanobacteria bacterium FACHB-63]
MAGVPEIEPPRKRKSKSVWFWRIAAALVALICEIAVSLIKNPGQAPVSVPISVSISIPQVVQPVKDPQPIPSATPVPNPVPSATPVSSPVPSAPQEPEGAIPDSDDVPGCMRGERCYLGKVNQVIRNSRGILVVTNTGTYDLYNHYGLLSGELSELQVGSVVYAHKKCSGPQKFPVC